MGKGSDVQYFHFPQHFGHGIHGGLHTVRADHANAADAEGFHLGQLARVKDEALGLDPLVEVLELIASIVRRMEGDYDRRLDLGWQEAAQAIAAMPSSRVLQLSA